MIDHISSDTTDYMMAKGFYQQVFLPLGYDIQRELTAEWNRDFPTQRMCAFGPEGKNVFWLIESKIPSTPRHIAFLAHSRTAVDEFYYAGLTHGGKDNGEPGLRPLYHKDYYGAFLIDPDGNNVEAVCHQATE